MSFRITVAVGVLLTFIVSEAIAQPRTATSPAIGRFTTSDGVQIHYLELGTSGSPVLLLHGFSSDLDHSWMQTGVAPALARNHRVVAFDLRGHGRSEKPHDPAKYAFRRFAQDALELMDYLSIRKAHVAGYSFGGGLVAVLMAIAPERFITAHLGGFGIPDPDPMNAAADAARDPRGTDPAEAAALEVVKTRPNDTVALGAAAEGRKAAPHGTRVDFATFPVPILLMSGEFDAAHAKTAYAAREGKRVEVVIVKGRGHLTTAADPIYVQTLAGFIDSHDSK